MRTRWNRSVHSRSNWKLEVLVLEERRKPEYPDKNLSVQRREPTTNSTHIWRRRQDSNLSHIDGRRVLSALCHPCSSCFILVWKDETWICGLMVSIPYSTADSLWDSSLTINEFGEKFGGRAASPSWPTWQEEQGSHWCSALKCFPKLTARLHGGGGPQVGEITG